MPILYLVTLIASVLNLFVWFVEFTRELLGFFLSDDFFKKLHDIQATLSFVPVNVQVNRAIGGDGDFVFPLRHISFPSDECAYGSRHVRRRFLPPRCNRGIALPALSADRRIAAPPAGSIPRRPSSILLRS